MQTSRMFAVATVVSLLWLEGCNPPITQPPGGTGSISIVVPNLVNQPLSDAQAQAEQRNLRFVNAGEEYDETVPSGSICRMAPGAGSTVIAQSEIRVWISRGQKPTSTSPFQGHWVGTWTDSRLSQSGTMDFTIESDGTLIASIHNNTLHETEATGTIDRHGKITYSYAYNGIKNDGMGTLVLDANSGHLKGAINVYSNSQDIGTDEVDLSKQ